MRIAKADVRAARRADLARIKERRPWAKRSSEPQSGPGARGRRAARTHRRDRGDLTPEERGLRFNVQPPAVILLAGLQGAGKTTSAGKLAKYLIEEKKKKVLTVSADVYRPAAIDQLKSVTAQAGAEWFPSEVSDKPSPSPNAPSTTPSVTSSTSSSSARRPTRRR